MVFNSKSKTSASTSQTRYQFLFPIQLCLAKNPRQARFMNQGGHHLGEAEARREASVDRH